MASQCYHIPIRMDALATFSLGRQKVRRGRRFLGSSNFSRAHCTGGGYYALVCRCISCRYFIADHILFSLQTCSGPKCWRHIYELTAWSLKKKNKDNTTKLTTSSHISNLIFRMKMLSDSNYCYHCICVFKYHVSSSNIPAVLKCRHSISSRFWPKGS